MPWGHAEVNAPMTEASLLGTRDSSLLLATFQHTAIERLSAVLDAVLQRADDYLFDRSGSGDDGAELTALRDLRRARAQLARHYGQALVAGFKRMQGKTGLADDDAMPELTLLAEDALEEQLATEQMVESLNRKYAAALELLDRRLADLLQRQTLVAGENPVSPGSITDALRSALHTVELSTSVRIALYKFAEREFTIALSPLYDRLNVTLAEAGILPDLRPMKSRIDPTPATRGQAPAQGQGQSAEPGTGIAQPMAPAMPETAPASESAFFGSLLQMLQSWRQRITPAAEGRAHDANAPHLQTPEMMSVLSLMQNEPPASLDLSADEARGSLPEQLRREVLAGAQRLGVGHAGLNLSSAHEDAVDLVGMLFDVLLDERDFEPDVRRKIGQMLVPYVKVAVKDRRLFLFKGHPARRFLNAVAEACVGNHGDGPQERELLDRVDTSIDRVVNEFNEDVAIFDTLEQELRAFLVQHRQRIDITERRTAEAQNGRERLELARGQAENDLDACRDQRHLPYVLQDFLGRYASHHLVQVSLREGRESPRYGNALQAVRALLASFDHAELGQDMAHLPALDRPGLAEILSSYGCDANAAADIIDRTEQCLRELASDEAPAIPVAPAPVPMVKVAPVGVTQVAKPGLEVVGGHDRLDFDPEIAERMRGLEVGTWLQLESKSGRVDPAKVSWISPISSRFLFVNRRGIRVLVASAEELAAMAKQGKVLLRQGDTAFDDALHHVMARLKSDTDVAAA